MMLQRNRILTVALPLSLALVACTGESKPSAAADGQSIPAEAIEQMRASVDVYGAKEVRIAFQAYRRAILEGKGAPAAAALSEGTVAWFDGIVSLALDAGSDELRKRSLVERQAVFEARLLMTPDELEGMDGRDYFAHTVDAGWVDGESVRTQTIGKILIDGDVAIGELHINGQAANYQFRFVKEDDQWRFDQLPILELANAELLSVIEARQVEENRFLIGQIEEERQIRVPVEIWNPLRSR